MALNTAKEMYAYCKQNGYGSGFNESWGIKHFSLVQKSLMPNEEVLMTFIGLHNYVSATKHDNNFAYAITNKRIIMAQKKLVGEAIQTVSFQNINDITYKSGMVFGIMVVDTFKEVFNIALDKVSAQKIYSNATELFHQLKNGNVINSNVGGGDAADQLMKFKQLLDSGVITQAEFDAKKKQLLGI